MWRPEGSTELGFERAMSAEVGIEQQLPFDSRLDVSLFGKTRSVLLYRTQRLLMLRISFTPMKVLVVSMDWKVSVKHQRVSFSVGCPIHFPDRREMTIQQRTKI